MNDQTPQFSPLPQQGPQAPFSQQGYPPQQAPQTPFPQQGYPPQQAPQTPFPQQGYPPQQAPQTPPVGAPAAELKGPPLLSYDSDQLVIRHTTSVSSGFLQFVTGGFALLCFVGGISNFFASEGTILGGITLLVVSLLVGFVYVFSRQSHIVLDAQGIHHKTLLGNRDYPWPRSRTNFFARLSISANMRRLAGNRSFVYLVLPDGKCLPFTGLSWTGTSISALEEKAVQECSRIWQWAVSRGYTQETGEYVRISSAHPLYQAMREKQEEKYRLR